jgi:hypothetical protein
MPIAIDFALRDLEAIAMDGGKIPSVCGGE